jgi:hypothetical protein
MFAADNQGVETGLYNFTSCELLADFLAQKKGN